MQAVVDNLMTHYEVAGKGTQILILPGWADESTSWLGFAAGLADGYQVITLDLPGFGATEVPKNDWGVNDYAKFVNSFVNKIGADPKIIIGHSHGGAIAISAVSSGLLAPAKLILLASAGVRNKGKSKKKALWLTAKTGKALTIALPAGTKKALRQKLYKAAGSDMLVVENMQGTFKKIVAKDMQAEAKKVNVPTLLVYGEKDNQTPVDYGRLLHKAIPGSTLKLVPDAGHFLQTDSKEPVLKIVEEFIG